MLMDFPVAVTVGAERYSVVCRDVSTAVFFYQYPATVQDDAIMTWLLGLLTRVAVTPALTLEHVHRLDHGAFEGVLGYCHAVGWFTEENLQHHAAMEGPIGIAMRRYQQSLGALSPDLLPIPASVPASFAASHLPYIGSMAPVVRQRVRAVARAGRVLASVVWNAPISETMLNYRLLIEDDQASGELRGDDALIGFED